ncbi:annexin ANXC4 [Metarhizium album ARSEF 1941]|uniref:Annexin ANXC4 n=1 Tax=Metarhizium album (strain ARSEF 1941) TaxID=1081103 RepID=A0A0B2WMN6_METAS|nr:annexin ANXC4 [Metarhizium album ARSEF 1941]KHN94255.1 annexin ANXC4 [Metarhizium album ARSEF 1941]
MSLAVEDDRRRDRSRSRSTSRDRRPRGEPGRPGLTRFADVREPSHVHPEDDLADGYTSRGYRDSAHGGGLPYPSEGGMDTMLPGSQSLYSYDDTRPVYKTASPPRESSHRGSRENPSLLPGSFPDAERLARDDDKERRVRYTDPRDSKHERRNRSDDGHHDLRARRSHKYARQDEGPGIRNPSPAREKSRDSRDDTADDKLKFLPQKYGRRYDADDASGNRDDRYSERHKDRTSGRDRRSNKERDQDDLAYGKPPGPSRYQRSESPPTYGSYISGSRVSDKRSSNYGRDEDDGRRPRPASPLEDVYDAQKSRHAPSYRDDSRGSANVLTVEPGSRDGDGPRDRRRDKSPGPSTLAPEASRKDRDRSRDRSKDRRGGGARDRSPRPPTSLMSSLAVDTGRSSGLSLATAPASPLLESYRGTYQDCSPMPSPLLIASKDASSDPEAIEEALSPLDSDADGPDGTRRPRRARFHDPKDIAATLAQALRGNGPPDTRPLVEILPSLTHDQVMELRSEYKRIVKTGSDRKGVNIAKHIRARLKDEDPSLMKACYAVALGKWESEAYWANFWYQGDKTRRELLVESLMGRTNDEIRRIKQSFTDKKYDNSLAQCMRVELKEDKFKRAVLTVLDERRMDDLDAYGRAVPVDYRLVDQDVDDLRRAVRAEKGGESAMIAVVVTRSDTHLRLVLQEYERRYRANFAREALKKSGNLVGEVLAHVLNGVINRPVRDALLLSHALTASRRDRLRRELLISRLVRFHWDPAHMQAVKRSYRERYGVDLQDAVREGTSGQWGRFCRELCIARMPDDVRRVERVEVIR